MFLKLNKKSTSTNHPISMHQFHAKFSERAQLFGRSHRSTSLLPWDSRIGYRPEKKMKMAILWSNFIFFIDIYFRGKVLLYIN